MIGLERNCVLDDKGGKSTISDDAAEEADLSQSHQMPNEPPCSDDAVNSDGSDALNEALEAAENFKRIAQRAQADLVNFRNRVADDIEEAAQRSAKRVAFPLMEVCDQLEAALDASASRRVADVWLTGMRSVYENILAVLNQAEFERFDSVGCDFDPTRHDAILLTPTTSHASGEIIRQLRAGYEYRGKVARPAQVEIAAEPITDR